MGGVSSVCLPCASFLAPPLLRLHLLPRLDCHSSLLQSLSLWSFSQSPSRSAAKVTLLEHKSDHVTYLLKNLSVAPYCQ